MNTATLEKVAISPVNMEDRKNLGIKAGDTVRVHQKIEEKGKTRIQIFEGLVLARKHGSEPGATFTVRKIASGVGVEKIFPLYSPLIDKIEIVRRSKVRRSKLYFIREKVAREIKRQMRRMTMVTMGTESEMEAAARTEQEAKEAAEAAKKAEEEAARVAEEAKKAEEEAAKAEEATKEEVETPSEEKNEEKEEAPEAVEETKEEKSEESTEETEEKKEESK